MSAQRLGSYLFRHNRGVQREMQLLVSRRVLFYCCFNTEWPSEDNFPLAIAVGLYIDEKLLVGWELLKLIRDESCREKDNKRNLPAAVAMTATQEPSPTAHLRTSIPSLLPSSHISIIVSI